MIERRSNVAIRAVACLSQGFDPNEILSHKPVTVYVLSRKCESRSVSSVRNVFTTTERSEAIWSSQRTQCGSPGKPSSQGLQSK